MSMRLNKRRGLPLAALVLAALAALAAGCGRNEAPAAAGDALPVVQAVTVQPTPLALSSELPGRIEPVRVAEVRARVAGIVLRRHFEEGADVRAGQVLFQIDPAPLRAALSRAQGQLASAEAALIEARAVVGRNAPLVAQEAVSRQDFEAMQARLQAAQAARQSAQAEVQAAALNLEYATVRAPIAGRIGRALVTEGALVGQGEATPMALVQQLDPVYADFQQPVAEAQRLRAALAEGRLAQTAGKDGTPVSLKVDGTGLQRTGQLLFSDVTVDRGTGQMALRGRFDNRDGMLLPGMYVRVTVGQGVDPAAILVPQRAVQRSTDGQAHVLVVDGQDTLQMRPVQTAAMHGAQWQISAGLKAGERVVVGRMAGLQPGARVQVTALSDAAASPTAGLSGTFSASGSSATSSD
ncbi:MULTISPECIES: efflux RND transporter periplasmic adaptor subunit [Delftia]|uniref:efflux RND transporter periplasmic adaptor subunit n=1 Tax=Delftia TaxID=80865 RepID=UPI000927ADC6|nr:MULTISPECIES: efflux RND transporter periplasmic adaptor subunit [Delftia]MDH0421511.1 efflux RND transporter periplasmic adaptor subunit [Delftia tsuruhatensis]OJX09991.1 MAG: efflux transporter periplasmic adaptor subunit [Delftia sp. 67-8]QFS63605.1 efflux RND transporter periplasmic adaptor subunit [Delftia tsuruhatensis]WON90937.1 efflux RND transporter periplasmic adaptor subunit [Delftia sp. UGAL515B_04]